MVRKIAFWGLLIACSSAYSQVLTDADAAFREATRTHRFVLLIFSGSDWCAPCIRFEKQVVATDTFMQFAAEHIVVLEADFPQRKRISIDTRAQNEALAERYNPEGSFPFLILLRSDRTPLRVFNYQDEAPESFISELRSTIDYETAEGNQAIR
jgi:thioredoxin-related protein